MEAKENSFNFINNEERIKIPFFQRPFVWELEHFAKFYDDLYKSFEGENTPFLGQIILKQIGSAAGKGSQRSLIDGQQRLTCFSLLIKALYDRLEERKRPFYTRLLYREAGDDFEPKLKHSRLDRVVYEAILGDKDCKDFEDSKIYKCFCFFKTRVEKLKSFKDFLDYIQSSECLVIVNLRSNDDEQKIFDSMNTAGLKLNSFDVIKNAIFEKILEEKGEELSIKLYEKYWQSAFEKDDEQRAFWEDDILKGNIKRTRGEFLLECFASLDSFYHKELSKAYKERIKDLDFIALEGFLKAIHEYALSFKGLPFYAKATSFSFDEENGLKRLLDLIELCKVRAAYVLILALRKKYKNDEINLKKAYNIIEKYIFSHFFMKEGFKNSGAFFSKEAKKILKNQDFNMNDFKNSFFCDIKNEDLLKSLKEKLQKQGANKLASFILSYIELSRRHDKKDSLDFTKLNANFTLEHLLPKSYEKHWGLILKNKGYKELAIKEGINSLGNLTLLRFKLNTSLKNGPWDKKLKEIKACADLSISKELLAYKYWDLESIKKRERRLFKDFLKLWGS